MTSRGASGRTVLPGGQFQGAPGRTVLPGDQSQGAPGRTVLPGDQSQGGARKNCSSGRPSPGGRPEELFFRETNPRRARKSCSSGRPIPMASGRIVLPGGHPQCLVQTFFGAISSFPGTRSKRFMRNDRALSLIRKVRFSSFLTYLLGPRTVLLRQPIGLGIGREPFFVKCVGKNRIGWNFLDCFRTRGRERRGP